MQCTYNCSVFWYFVQTDKRKTENHNDIALYMMYNDFYPIHLSDSGTIHDPSNSET